MKYTENVILVLGRIRPKTRITFLFLRYMVYIAAPQDLGYNLETQIDLQIEQVMEVV